VILVSLGGWIRGTEVVSAAVLQNFNEDSAKVLRQPALVSLIKAKVNGISSETRNDPLVRKVSDQLEPIEKLVAFPPGKPPTVDDVRKVHEAVGHVMTDIQQKPESK
jgi:hypothetical protein